MNNSSVDVSWDKDRHAAGCRQEVHENGILALGTRHEDGRDFVAGIVHLFDDLTSLHSDEFHRSIVPESHVIGGLVRVDTNHGALHGSIRNGRSVAPQITIEEVVSGEVGDGGSVHFVLHVLKVGVQKVVNVFVFGSGEGHSLVIGRVDIEDVAEQLAGGRLTTLGHPVLGKENVTVRTPDTRDKDGVLGHGKMACRSTSDSS